MLEAENPGCAAHITRACGWMEPSLWEDVVEIETWDVSALYPFLKIEYVMMEIDTLIVERIESRKGEEKKGAEALIQIVFH